MRHEPSGSDLPGRIYVQGWAMQYDRRGRHNGRNSGRHNGRHNGRHSGRHNGRNSGRNSGRHSGRGLPLQRDDYGRILDVHIWPYNGGTFEPSSPGLWPAVCRKWG